MLRSKDLESYINAKEFMTMNGIKDIYVIAKITVSKLAPVIVTSAIDESRKFYTLACT